MSGNTSGSERTGIAKMRRIARLMMGLALGAAVLGQGHGADARPRDRYVSLGDSFTAGPLIPVQVEPLGCLKSNRNYPNLVNAALGSLRFRDISCSGAKTDDMFAPQSVEGPDNPAQLSALTSRTTVVTLGIGGNDIGFTEIIKNCATLNPYTTPCQDRYVNGGVDEISRRIKATAPKIAKVLNAIERRSPNARVFVVGYPQVLPDKGLGCWPSLPIAYDDVPYLRTKAKELNGMLRTQASNAGVGYVNTYKPSEGRSACALPTVRWVEPLVPVNPAAPVHPNARGMAGIAGVVSTAVA
ncbi:MAG: SGNH/GDSL hydrolase family protein [Ilumatobacteraceae bacterium]